MCFCKRDLAFREEPRWHLDSLVLESMTVLMDIQKRTLISICVYPYMYTHLHVHGYHMYVCTYTSMYVHVQECMYIYMNVCTYTST